MRIADHAVTLCIALSACSPDGDSRATGDSMAAAASQALSPDSVVSCLEAGQSVLARAPQSAAPGSGDLRGWIKLVRKASDSGAAHLIDSDGFALEATWRSVAGDSVVVSGFNDFVRVEFRLRLLDSLASGSFSAHSDAALERDSAGTLREFRRSGTISLRQASCDGLPRPAGTAAIDMVPDGAPRPGIRFDPSTTRPGSPVGVLVLDSIEVRRALDSTFVGTATFRGEIDLRGWTLRHPDPDLYRVTTCFEADSSSGARLPRWTGDERRSWFCFSNRADAARALGAPSEGVPATIVIDRFTIHRGHSDEVNTARFVRLVRRGGASRG